MEATRAVGDGITVRWTMEASDLVGGLMLYQRRMWSLLRIAAVVLGVTGLVFLAIGADPSLWLPLIVGAVFFGYTVIFGPRRSVKRQGRSLIGEDVTFRVDDQGVHQDFAGGHVWTEWWALTEAVDDASTIVIKRDRLPSFYIPKRAFATESEAEAFLAYVRSHLGSTRPASEASYRSAPPIGQ